VSVILALVVIVIIEIVVAIVAIKVAITVRVIRIPTIIYLNDAAHELRPFVIRLRVVIAMTEKPLTQWARAERSVPALYFLVGGFLFHFKASKS